MYVGGFALDALKKIRGSYVSCLPFLSILNYVFILIDMVVSWNGQVQDDIAETTYRVETTTMKDGRVDDFNVSYEKGDAGSSLVFHGISLFLVCVLGFFAYSYLVGVYEYSTRGPNICVYVIFTAGFAAQFSESRLDNAEALFDSKKTRFDRYLFGVAGVVSLFAGYYVLKYPEIMNIRGGDLLNSDMSFPVVLALFSLFSMTLYAGFFRPLACCFLVLVAYYAGSENKQGVALNPVNALVLVVVVALYLVSTGVLESAEMLQGRVSPLLTVTWKDLIYWLFYWGVVLAVMTMVGSLVLLGTAFMLSGIINAVPVFALAYVVSQGLYFGIHRMFDVRDLTSMTHAIMSVSVMPLIQSFIFWGFIIASVALPGYLLRKGRKFVWEAVAAHLYLLLVIGLIFNAPKYSALAARYLDFVAGLFAWVPSLF